jgi:hypothetical protein
VRTLAEDGNPKAVLVDANPAIWLRMSTGPRLPDGCRCVARPLASPTSARRWPPRRPNRSQTNRLAP